MYKHILAALDGSARAPYVLRHAAEVAARSGARLHLVRAVTVPHGVPVDAFTMTGDQLTAHLLEHGAQELTRLAEGFNPDLTPVLWGRRICRFGAPAQLVIDVADELCADLIVIGSHGYDFADRLLGTTAARIVNHAACSVLVVRGVAPAAG